MNPKIDATPAALPQDRAEAAVRPAYEPPRVTKKKAVTRATLFTAPPSSPPPLIVNP